jgi:dienelactone hydrolase
MPDLNGVPASLRRSARWLSLAGVPALVAHPDWHAESGGKPPNVVRSRPWLLWIHGRSVNKELDPGRYLRLLRAGIASVAVDLPGHGERREEWAQDIAHTLRMIRQMHDELDAVVDAVGDIDGFDRDRAALGGMSAGGMVSLARLCRPHRFVCAAVECTTGSWRWQTNLMRGDPGTLASLNPIGHLDQWRPIPLFVLHNRLDEWVPIEGQEEFLAALAKRYPEPATIEFHAYDETGAPNEHAGFGRMGADAKDRLTAFLRRRLLTDERS